MSFTFNDEHAFIVVTILENNIINNPNENLIEIISLYDNNKDLSLRTY
jgi:hypothetical protein